jgi:hypothetical protein
MDEDVEGKAAGRGSPSTGLESSPHRSTADAPVPHRVQRLEWSLGPEYRSTCVDRMTVGLAHELLSCRKARKQHFLSKVTPMYNVFLSQASDCYETRLRHRSKLPNTHRKNAICFAHLQSPSSPLAIHTQILSKGTQQLRLIQQEN